MCMHVQNEIMSTPLVTVLTKIFCVAMEQLETYSTSDSDTESEASLTCSCEVLQSKKAKV